MFALKRWLLFWKICVLATGQENKSLYYVLVLQDDFREIALYF